MKLWPIIFLLASCANIDTGGSVYVIDHTVPGMVKDIVEQVPSSKQVFTDCSKALEELSNQKDQSPEAVKKVLSAIKGQSFYTQMLTDDLLTIYTDNWNEAKSHGAWMGPTMMPLLRAMAEALDPNPKKAVHPKPTIL